MNRIEYCQKECDKYLAALGWRPSVKVSWEQRKETWGASFEPVANRLILWSPEEKQAPACLYRFLSRAGCIFDMEESWAASDAVTEQSLVAAGGSYENMLEACGVRQHINFPMDISSYTLEGAKEYIRNLARCGFNFITFHSYPNQWYEVHLPHEEEYGGYLYYSRQHPVPQNHTITPYIDNKQYYYIPELEGLIGQEKKLSQSVMEWLSLLMDEAVLCGLEIQFSFEPRDHSVEDTLRIADQILAAYPQIQTLELITQECGGWGNSAWTVDEIKQKVRELYAEKAEECLADIAPYLAEKLCQLPMTMRELRRNLDAAAVLEQRYPEKGIALGIYATDAAVLNICLQIMRRYAPARVKFSFLPSHGATAAAENIGMMDLTAADMARTTFYSWVEFDGSMYLQQHAVRGLEQCLAVLEKKCTCGQKGRLAVNHWRTAENVATLSYLSFANRLGRDRAAFYREEENRLGITEADGWQTAWESLEDASEYARYHLWNIGFCYLGCWCNERLGFIGDWQVETLNEGMEKYNIARSNFMALPTDAKGRISFVLGKIECTLLHLTAIRTLLQLQDVCGEKQPGTLNEEERTLVLRICRNAEFYVDAYMQHYCRNLWDRGCQGQVMSYQNTLPEVIRRLREKYGENKAQQKVDAGKDAPPPPAIMQ